MPVYCESERLYLRPVEISDSNIIAQWKDDSLIKEMSVGLDTIINVENQEADIKISIEKGHPYYIIVEKNFDKPIGYIRVSWMDDTNHFAWLRFGLGEERGKGYSKEALHCFIKKLFGEGTHRIEAEVYDFNIASYKILFSLGFKHEGTRREAYFSNSAFFDVHMLGLIKSDYVD